MGSLGERQTEIGLQSALRHLLAMSQDASGWRKASADPAAYDGLFDRVARNADQSRRRLETERREAALRWQALEGHPQPRRLVRVRNDHRFQTLGFHQLLLAKSRKQAAHAPEEALELAELALAVVRSLAAPEHGEERIADLRAATWIAIADARTHLRDNHGAWDAIDCAQEALEEGTQDPLDRADLEKLRARLLRAAGRDEEANRASRRAQNLLRRIGDVQTDASLQQGRTEAPSAPVRERVARR